MYKLLLTVAFLATAALASTPFRSCGSDEPPYAQLIELRVEGCTTLPCIVQRGTNVSVELDFIARSEITAFHTALFGDLGSIVAPWPGAPFPPGCEALSAGECPLSDGEAVTYVAQISVSTSWPAIQATALWKLKNQDDAEFACFQVPLRLI